MPARLRIGKRVIAPILLGASFLLLLVAYTNCAGEHQDFSAPSGPAGGGPSAEVPAESNPEQISYAVKILESADLDSGAGLSSISYQVNSARSLKCRLIKASATDITPATCAWSVVNLAGAEIWADPAREEISLPSLTTGVYYLWAKGPAEFNSPRSRVILTVTSSDGAPPSAPSFSVAIEDKPDGTGTKVTSLTIPFGATSTLHAVARDGSGRFLQTVSSGWSVEGEIGTLTISSDGKQASYKGEYPGAGRIRLVYSDAVRFDANLTISAPSLAGTVFTRIFAIGPRTGLDESRFIKNDGTITTLVSESDQVIQIAWQADSALEREGWGIFKSQQSGVFDLTSPWLELPASTTTFTDKTGQPGRYVYYLVLPKRGGYSRSYQPLQELRVLAPPPNRAFIHRAMANLRMCEFMLQHNAVDPVNFNRCPYSGPGHLGGFYDIGNDFLADRFEAGVNTASPAVTVQVQWKRPTYMAGSQEFSNLSAAALAGHVAYSAQIPPLNVVSQVTAFDLCRARNIALIDGGATRTFSMRLPRMAEWRTFAMWSPSRTDTEIQSLEYGGSGNCNSDYGRTYTTSNLNEPIGMSLGVLFPTGSINASPSCVSEFGLQDAAGNVPEWISDQCDWDLEKPPYLCRKPLSPLDSSRLSLEGIALGGVDMNSVGYGFSPWFLPAHGLPLNDYVPGALKTPRYQTRFNDDQISLRFFLSGALMGGSYAPAIGVWQSIWQSPWSSMGGFRCVAELGD